MIIEVVAVELNNRTECEINVEELNQINEVAVSPTTFQRVPAVGGDRFIWEYRSDGSEEHQCEYQETY